ncbi:GNAT family N-acetyltransferase [Streptomyces sp. NPDC102451]|uniref:GNAT family N-acetyltransferase n=1 Tax=Streptomyces sp. NPDC102451 TaxID=3366177 RepID=UPI00381F2B26
MPEATPLPTDPSTPRTTDPSTSGVPAPGTETGTPHPLDNPARAALTGPHAHFAERRGRILRYRPDVTPWLALPDAPEAQDWADVATLAGPGSSVTLTAFREPPPADWEIVFQAEGVQLVDDTVDAAPDPEAVLLGPDDVPEMLDLVGRTRPGPFLPRTVELGTYLGVRRDGVLVAMAGERLHPPGWTEISGVCTDSSVRGQGLATRLVRAVAHGIRERGETPFLHAAASNTSAIRLYESLGFTLRRRTSFLSALVPADVEPRGDARTRRRGTGSLEHVGR